MTFKSVDEMMAVVHTDPSKRKQADIDALKKVVFRHGDNEYEPLLATGAHTMTNDDNGVFVPPKETYTVKARVCFRDDIDAKAALTPMSDHWKSFVDAISKPGAVVRVDVPQGNVWSGHSYGEAATRFIASALLAARNEALEEAAKVADEEDGDPEGTGSHATDFVNQGRNETASEIATAIRALKGGTP